jgi:hypothetical protein
MNEAGQQVLDKASDFAIRFEADYKIPTIGSVDCDHGFENRSVRRCAESGKGATDGGDQVWKARSPRRVCAM